MTKSEKCVHFSRSPDTYQDCQSTIWNYFDDFNCWSLYPLRTSAMALSAPLARNHKLGDRSQLWICNMSDLKLFFPHVTLAILMIFQIPIVYLRHSGIPANWATKPSIYRASHCLVNGSGDSDRVVKKAIWPVKNQWDLHGFNGSGVHFTLIVSRDKMGFLGTWVQVSWIL
jgi:hypothetical protein